MKTFPNRLTEGYRSFMGGNYRVASDRFHALAETGQKPETLVIACCDSRAAPEMIFDTGPGEIFVLRNVANLVPPYQPDDQYHSTSAALEFAVQSLEVKHILIMGHGRCGGIAAALSPDGEPLSPGDFIGKWMSLIDDAAETVASRTELSPEERQRMLERQSVRNSIENLRSFPYVKEREERGDLVLHGGWFDIASGELWVLESGSNEFQQVSSS